MVYEAISKRLECFYIRFSHSPRLGIHNFRESSFKISKRFIQQFEKNIFTRLSFNFAVVLCIRESSNELLSASRYEFCLLFVCFNLKKCLMNDISSPINLFQDSITKVSRKVRVNSCRGSMSFTVGS